MKLPSLDTSEGIVVLALGVFVAYVGYRAYKVGAGIANSVSDTLSGAVDAVENVAHGVEGVVKSAASGTNAIEQQQKSGYSPIDGVELWPLPGGLGTDTPVTNAPQTFSPSAVPGSDIKFGTTDGGWED